MRAPSLRAGAMQTKHAGALHVVATCALACDLVLGGCGSGATQSVKPPPPTVTLAIARRKTIETTFTLDGNVAPSLQSTLGAQQPGNVVAVYVNEGDRVAAGQLLAKIDDAPLRAQLVQKIGTAHSMSAKLAQSSLQHPVTSQGVSSALVQAGEALTTARDAERSANASVGSTDLIYRADRTLLVQGYVSKEQEELARQQFVAAVETKRSAQNAVMQAAAALDAARRNLDEVPIQGQDIASNRGLVEEARGEVQQLETAIEQTSIVAPYAGTIVARQIDPGGYASPNQPIFQIAKVDRVYVNFNVPDEDLDDVRTGTHVDFTTAARRPHAYAGHVVEVNAVPSSGTLTYRARLIVENPDLRLRGGQLVTVTVTRRKQIDAIAVPRSAVLTSNGVSDLYVVQSPPPPAADATPAAPSSAPSGSGEPARFAVYAARKVTVGLGLETDTEVAVHGGPVRPGTKVIEDRSDSIRDGGLVRVPLAAPTPGAGP